MAKSVSKSASKKTKLKPETVEQVSDASKNLESYVPKITHWTKVKKDKTTDQPEVQEASVDEKVDTTDVRSEEGNGTTQKAQELNLKTKLDDLKSKVFQDKEVNKTPIKEEIIENQTTQPESTTISVSLNNSQNNPAPVAGFTKPPVTTPITVPQTNSKLPSFLNRMATTPKPANQTNSMQNSTKNLKNEDMAHDGVNSLAMIFQRDQDEISNIKRVFRKSIMFLTIALLSFGLSSLSSSNFSIQSLVAFAITSLGFIALTNIFFIIVAHRTYIWLFLIGQFIILMITQYPYSFNLSTLLVGIMVILLSYLSYLDLEKVQLGSRLFSVPYIVGESTKILSTVIIFIVCLSVFNQVTAKGLDKFAGDSILSVPVVMDRATVPLYENTVLRNSGINFTSDTNLTVRSLICAEYKLNCSGRIISADENAKIDKVCKDSNLDEITCNENKRKAEDEFLNKLKNEELSNLNLNLNSKIDKSNYRLIVSQLIQNRIKSISNPDRLSFLPKAVPVQLVIPLIVSVLLFVILSIFKFVLVWMGYISTWILWKLLQITGFVRLDIEMVEAEIVGI